METSASNSDLVVVMDYSSSRPYVHEHVLMNSGVVLILWVTSVTRLPVTVSVRCTRELVLLDHSKQMDALLQIQTQQSRHRMLPPSIEQSDFLITPTRPDQLKISAKRRAERFQPEISQLVSLYHCNPSRKEQRKQKLTKP